MKNIVLIGMAGAGKSTIGVILAKTLGMPFVDTDLIIQEKQSRLLQTIIEQEGIEGFLTIEAEVIKGMDVKKHIVATGGSVVYSEEAMFNLRENGIIVYLELSYEEIEKRLINIKTRGIAMEKGKTLKDVYLERLPLYNKYADIVIPCDNKDAESIVEEIGSKLIYS